MATRRTEIIKNQSGTSAISKQNPQDSAEILYTREMIEKTQSTHHSQYIKFTGILTPVTYFSKVVNDDNTITNSGMSVSSANINQFDQINKLDVKFMDDISISDEGDDVAKSFVKSGTILILPKTILPKVSDCFVLRFHDSVNLYNIEEVELDSTSIEPAYTCKFSIANEGEDFIFSKSDMSRRIRDTFVYQASNIGTVYKTLFLIDERNNLNKLIDLYNYIGDIFCDLFYDKSINTFIMKFKSFDFKKLEYKEDNSIYYLQEELFYDNSLTNFIKSNGIFSKYKGRVLLPKRLLGNISQFNYAKTIFSALEHRDQKLFRNRKFEVTKIASAINDDIYMYGKHKIEHVESPINSEEYTFFSKTLFDNLETDILTSVKLEDKVYNSPTDMICEIIAGYIKKVPTEEIFKSLTLLESIKADLHVENIFPSNIYYLYPILAFICNKVYEEFSRNSNNEV